MCVTPMFFAAGPGATAPRTRARCPVGFGRIGPAEGRPFGAGVISLRRAILDGRRVCSIARQPGALPGTPTVSRWLCKLASPGRLSGPCGPGAPCSSRNRPGCTLGDPIPSEGRDPVDAMNLIYVFPAAAVLALIYAYIRAAWVKKQDPGNERIQMIASWIAQGAMAFLTREDKVLAID